MRPSPSRSRASSPHASLLLFLVAALAALLTSNSAAAEPRECARTAECDRGERCVRRACVPERRGGSGDTCEADADCDDGLSCERSVCRRAADARTRGTGVELTTQLDSEALRQAWIRRGGTIVSYEVRGQVTGIVGTAQTLEVTQPCFSGTSISTRRGSVEGRSGGVGGGLGGRIGVVGLSPPDGPTWLAFRAGTGFDASMTSYRALTGGTFTGSCSDKQASVEPTFQTSSATVLSVPFGAGVLLGLGSGKDARWRGAVLGIAYVPTYTYVKPSEGEGSGRLSYLGFEGTLDVTTLEAAIDKVAAAAHLRLFAFVVPPVKQDWPWVISAGGGAVWYLRSHGRGAGFKTSWTRASRPPRRRPARVAATGTEPSSREVLATATAASFGDG